MSKSNSAKELYGAVVEPITDKDTLLNLLVTSKLLYLEAARRLYDDIYLESNGGDQNEVARELSRDTSFFKTVCGNHYLANLVHHFLFSTESELENVEYWNWVTRGIRQLTQLTMLRFLCMKPVAFILEGCIFQLNFLKWYSSYCEEQLTTILNTQSSLEYLYLSLEARSSERGDIMRLHILHYLVSRYSVEVK